MTTKLRVITTGELVETVTGVSLGSDSAAEYVHVAGGKRLRGDLSRVF